MVIYLLTYLCGQNKTIIGFRTALKLLSRCLCFARACYSSSHRAKSGPLQPGLTNAYAVVPPAADRQAPHQTLFSRRNVFIQPGQRNSRILIRLATSMSLKSSYSFRFGFGYGSHRQLLLDQ